MSLRSLSRSRPRSALSQLSKELTRQNASQSIAREIKPLTSILVANRGEIAIRVGKTAKQHGVKTTAIYTDPDARSQHALTSKYAINLGAASAYLDGKKIIDVAKREGCDSIHPGYGFLSENADFAKSCKDAGLTFIGPPPSAIEAMGSKRRSKEIMEAAGVRCVPGYHGENQDADFLLAKAEEIGFPVLLKAVMGGGGKGMRISRSKEDFLDQLASAKSEAKSSFGDQEMLVEKYIDVPRHIEVQVFADKYGNSVALGERDCSIQRRHQKIIEESPAPNLDDAIRKDLWDKARQAAVAVGYEGAGTVEFIFDNTTGEFFFMEMNTRLQVEHPVTEMVTGQDLVLWQIQVAEGSPLPMTQDEIEKRISELGHAVEARIYAENPNMNFIPDSGEIVHMSTPSETADVRLDAGTIQGDVISPHYDPMIAKLIVRGKDRETAIRKLYTALGEYEVAGVVTNIPFLRRLCESEDFIRGDVETGYIGKHSEELFDSGSIPAEVWAQGALSIVLNKNGTQSLSSAGPSLGFSSSFQTCSFRLTSAEASDHATKEEATVEILQTSPDTYDVTVNGELLSGVRANTLTRTRLQSFFPRIRFDSNVIFHDDKISIFNQGLQYEIKQEYPKWLEKALGKKDAANSVVAPMPCKILRVDVQQGQDVAKDQPLLVIESMKMETTIRSPQEGRISKVSHEAGEICKAGTILVEFEQDQKGDSI